MARTKLDQFPQNAGMSSTDIDCFAVQPNIKWHPAASARPSERTSVIVSIVDRPAAFTNGNQKQGRSRPLERD